MFNQISILNVKIDNINYKQTIKKIDRFIKSKKPHQIITVNPEIIMAAQNDENYKKILNSSDLNVADGAGLWWAAKYTHQKLNYRITGVDLIDKMTKLAAKKKYRMFFLGGQNKAGEYAADNLREKYPNLHVAGCCEGYPIIKDKLTKKENLKNIKLINKILKTNPDILLVAYGAPKQEKFIAKYKNKLNIPVIIGVGGAFDFISGRIKRAPKWMQTLHIEWLYRLIQQPSRLNRIVTATIRFPWAVINNKKLTK